MAFPTTSVLDDFNRANGAPGANWGTNVIEAYSSMTISSNTLARAAANWESNYWVNSFAADQEAYYTIGSFTGVIGQVVARLASPNDNANRDCYGVHFDSGNSYLIKTVNGTDTQLGFNLGVAFAAGDSIGIECVGSTITAYRKPAAGSWTQIGQETDSAITAGGFIGAVFGNATVFSIDNFGGGAIAGQTLYPDPEWLSFI